MSAKRTFLFFLTTCYFIFGVSEGAATTESGISNFVTQVSDHIEDSVTKFPASTANVTDGIIKNGYSFLRRPVADRLRTHRLFPRLNRIVAIIFGTVMVTIAGIVAGAGGTGVGAVLILATIVGAAFIIAVVVVAVVTLTFMSIFF